MKKTSWENQSIWDSKTNIIIDILFNIVLFLTIITTFNAIFSILGGTTL